MFVKQNLSFKSSKVLNPLVQDYIENKETISSLFDYPPSKIGFKNLLSTNPYSNFDRELLSGILLDQSKLVSNTTQETLNNISIINQKKTYTVTTGHQLCLFTGPVYFINKILTTINLSDELNKEFPEHYFVPIYWMASEDHDFDEVNHFNAFEKKIEWNDTQTGAVGNFDTKELKNILPFIKKLFGNSDSANELILIFENAYLKNNTLAQATRFLVNTLFGKYGLIIADGNDSLFKNQFKNQFKKDIFENTAFKEVKNSIAKINSLGYSSQVNPREINCFYLEKNVRTRIEKKDSHFELIGTEKKLSDFELIDIIENKPEKISPNVVLRPVYQQTILPNLCYVGGPSEIAYWLEFKQMFNSFEVIYPILMPRNFVTILDKKIFSKIEKLNLSIFDFFQTEEEIINKYIKQQNCDFELEAEKEKIKQVYSEIQNKILSIEKTLEKNILAELQKQLNGIDEIVNKAKKAIKQKSEFEINQIKKIKLKLFPINIPQERFENFSSFYIKYGETFVDKLKNNIEPFNYSHVILTEESF